MTALPTRPADALTPTHTCASEAPGGGGREADRVALPPELGGQARSARPNRTPIVNHSSVVPGGLEEGEKLVGQSIEAYLGAVSRRRQGSCCAVHVRTS